MKKWLLASTVCATLLATAGMAPSQTVDGSAFRGDWEGNWYHPVEPESWLHVGSELAVIDATLGRIANAEGERLNADQPDTLATYGPGNWIYEWNKAGDAALAEAKAAEETGDAALAKAKYLAATSYYVRASSPHTNAPENIAALERAQASYREAGRFLPVPLKVIEVPYEGKTFKANLHLPEGEGPFPLVVMSFGSDVAKEEGMPFFEKQLAIRGIGLLMIDMPGMGDSRDWVITPDIDKLHAAAIDHAKTLAGVDGKNIFVLGASFGGTPVARAFLARPELDLAGAIYICGPMHRPFMATPEAYAGFPQFTIDGVRSRTGLAADAGFDAISAKLQPLSLVDQGLLGDDNAAKIDTPLLVLTTNDDPVAPAADLDLLLARAANSKAIIYDMPGHCPDRDSREAIAASWIVDQLRD